MTDSRSRCRSVNCAQRPSKKSMSSLREMRRRRLSPCFSICGEALVR
ncbi:MAG: hypothetical protein OXU61_12635 [Gammaproteobacteria bacterium]|nr:hypothetical protein [Gammaproteobacteria bacterium]